MSKKIILLFFFITTFALYSNDKYDVLFDNILIIQSKSSLNKDDNFIMKISLDENSKAVDIEYLINDMTYKSLFKFYSSKDNKLYIYNNDIEQPLFIFYYDKEWKINSPAMITSSFSITTVVRKDKDINRSDN